jgi:glycerophosphoryl diester phosphodiesterase
VTHPYLRGPGPLAFAHRGGAAVGDENSLAAFGRAVALGYRHLETDTHVTRDGVAVVFHDDTTDRMLGRPGRIADFTWADLATVRVAGEAVVPRLDDLLGAFGGAYLNIDVKADGAEAATVAAVDKAGARGRVLLASFADRRLAELRRLAGPEVATSLGQRAGARLWAASRAGFGGRGAAAGAVAAQMPLRAGRLTVVDRRFIRYAHRLGLAVHVWTVDDPTDIGDLLDAGVDGIMTDHIDVLRDVYAARGLWPA